MSRIAKWFAVLIVLLSTASAGQAGARLNTVSVCGSSGGHLVIARDVQAEVYRVEKSDSEFYEYRGCMYGSRRSFRLGLELISGSPFASFGVSNVTLAGTTVAYALERSSGTGEFEKRELHVLVVSVRTGKTVHKVPTGILKPAVPGVVGAGETRTILVKSNGSVAWINDKFQKENRFEVHALDTTGERVLAVGSNIAPESLALAGNMLYWIQDGKPFSAVLH
jgi:hypothetical protein